MLKRLLLICLALVSLAAIAGCRTAFNPSAAVDAGSDFYKAASLTDEEIQNLGRQTT